LTIYGTTTVLSMLVCQSHVMQSHLFMFYIHLKGRMGNLGSLWNNFLVRIKQLTGPKKVWGWHVPYSVH